MKAIAVEAGTSVETVYAQGAKSALLLACVDRSLPAMTTASHSPIGLRSLRPCPSPWPTR